MTVGLGEFMVTKTDGWIGKVIRVPVNHAAIYIGKGFIVEAQPGGARITQAKNYPDAVWSTHVMDVHTRLVIMNKAIDFVGTPYNFLDIGAQAIVRVFHWKAPKWALNRVSSPRTLQCAQLVDEVYMLAGVKLFKDGRPEGLVSPGDLYDLIEGK
jgi:hypothetical protein